jgi:hypothetical protein
MPDNKPLTPEEFADQIYSWIWESPRDATSQEHLKIIIEARDEKRDESIRREALQKAAIAICWRCNRTNEYRNIASDGTHEQIATGNHEWCDARLIYDMMRGLPIDTPPAAKEPQ